MVKYIAKPNTWFDAGTEVKLIEKIRCPNVGETCSASAIFEGQRTRNTITFTDKEICFFDEFDIIEDNET